MPDWEQRGNLDKLREDVANEQGYRAPSDREGFSNRTDFLREDGPARGARVDSQRRSGPMGRILELGMTAVGAIAAYKFLHQTGAGIELATELAKKGRYVRKSWNKVLHTILDAASPNDPRARAMLTELRETGTSELGRIDSVGRIADAIAVVKRHKRMGQDVMQTDLGRVMQDSFKRQAQAPTGYLALTAGELLVDKSATSLVGRNQLAILREGVDLGIIDSGTHLGRGLFRKAGTTSTAGIKDTRPFLLRSLGRGFDRALEQMRIPIIGWKMSSIVKTPGAILGEHRGITAIPHNAVIPHPGGGGYKLTRELNYLVDGKLMVGDLAGAYTQVADGLKPIFRSEHKDLVRTGGAMYGHFKEPMASRGPMGWLERKVGVGRAYRTEKSVFSTLFLDPVRRLFRGKTVLKDEIRRKATSRTPQNEMIDYLMESGGHVSKDYGKVANTYNSMGAMSPAARGLDKARAAYGKGKFIKYTGTGPDEAIKGVALPQPGIGFPGAEAFLLPKAHKWHMLANWLTMRPADLLSYTTGIAYKPGSGLHGYAKNLARLYGVWHGANLGIEAAKYLDYQIEDTTGVSPIKAVASAYVGLRVAQKGLQDTLGITDAAKYAEDLMPLSMTSTASGLARMTLPGLIGGIKAGPKGLVAGLAASAIMGGPAQLFWPEDITKGRQEYLEELTGERKVPVRANRWWEFNAEEFSGGRIKYFKPHWYKQMMSDYQYSDVKYGSKDNYFKKVSALPTPSNWFGLRRDEGWLGQVHAADRPYPHVPGEPMAGMGLGSRGYLRAGAGADALDIGNPDDIQSKFNKVFESGTEFLGLYKFLGESILGIQAPFKHETAWASSSEMTSQHNAFWESDMGGLGGMTELLRRFILPRNALPESYNPLPNQMPSWLPGERSVFDQDQRYFLDFHRGDPYRVVPQGEYRMPGPGYEALHRMHSGQPAIYDAMDRYQILADVAPHSMAFRHYRTIVKSWQNAGVLDESWSRQYDMTEAEVEAKKAGGRYVNRKFTGHDKDIQAINEATKYNGFERAVGSAWEYATHDVAAAIPLLGSKFLRARTPLAAYKEEQLYGETFKDWKTPYDAFIAPHFRMAIADNPVGGMGRGMMATYMGANPISRTVFGIAGGLIGGIGSSVRAAATGQWSGGWVPGEKQEEWATMEYMDRLEYVRARRLQGIAQMEGDSAAVLRYKNEAERTITGLPANASTGQMQGAMPPHLKKYFRGLLNTEDASRDQILEMLPSHIGNVFSRAWGRNENYANPDDVAADYFNSHELPDDKWLGWHPNVPFGVSKIKIIDTAQGSPSTKLHHFGLWEKELNNYNMLYAEMEAPSTSRLRSPFNDGLRTGDALRRELQGIQNMTSSSVRTRFGYGGVYMDTRLDNSGALRDHIDNSMRGY